MSFFDEVETTVANTRFLQAVEDQGPVVINLPSFEEIKDFEAKVREKLSVRRLLRANTVGYYLFKQWLKTGDRTSDHILALCASVDDYRRVPASDRKRCATRLMLEHLDMDVAAMAATRATKSRSTHIVVAAPPSGGTPRIQAEEKKSADVPLPGSGSVAEAPVVALRRPSGIFADSKEADTAEQKEKVRAGELTSSTSNASSRARIPASGATTATNDKQPAATEEQEKEAAAARARLLVVDVPPATSNAAANALANIISPTNVVLPGSPVETSPPPAAPSTAPAPTSLSSLPPVTTTATPTVVAANGHNHNSSSDSPASGHHKPGSAKHPRALMIHGDSANNSNGGATGTPPAHGGLNTPNSANAGGATPTPQPHDPLLGGASPAVGPTTTPAITIPPMPATAPTATLTTTASGTMTFVATSPTPGSGPPASSSNAGTTLAAAPSSTSGAPGTTAVAAAPVKELARGWPQEVLDATLKQMELPVCPVGLFDIMMDALGDRLKDKLPVFMTHDLYKKYVRCEAYCRQPVKLKDFRIFRVLGRGAFGAVSAVQKIDTHAIFAMKEMGKKQVKTNQSEWMVNNEKKVLSKMHSPFVLNLKYSFHNEETLYLIFDMCSGGDLKFHLKSNATVGKDRAFSNERSRFYAAEVLLGLEHIHSFDIVYRDLKPNNILLDTNGHVKISDLGLTIKLRKNKVLKHLAGTAGYWAPEIVMKTGTYKASDFWSFGVFLYEMLAGRRPRCKCGKKGDDWCPFGQKRLMEENAVKDNALTNLRIEVDYPPDKFSLEARDLLQKLFIVDANKRLGANGAHEIKQHPYFSSIDWHRLEALDVKVPFLPDARTVNANSIGEVGEFNKGKFKKIKITPEDEKQYEGFTHINAEGVQEELVTALIKADNPSPTQGEIPQQKDPAGCCCVIL